MTAVRRAAPLAALLALAAAPVALRAQTPTVPPTIEACYVPASGTIYRVNSAASPAPGAPANCLSATHVRFAWNQQGLPGAAGAPGAKGDKGDTGPAGPAGPSTGPASGDLAGSFPAPTVARLQGRPVAGTAPAASQVLTWSGTQWAPAAPPALALPKDAHGRLDLSNPEGIFSRYEAFIDGVRPLGTVGVGQRFIWHASKGALRAGYVETGAWDDVNIGRSSVAFGSSTRARGDFSFAAGSGSIADGSGAVALGSGAVASAIATFATGAETTASGDASVALGAFATTNGRKGTFVFGDLSTLLNGQARATAIADNSFVVRAQRVWLGTTSTQTAFANRFLETSTGAYLSTGGTWTNSSDVRRKTAFRPLDGERVLSRLAALPISTWRYRADSADVRHAGPTAQDFRRAFGLGGDSVSIGTVDADGIALAAAKALEARTRTLAAGDSALRAENAALRERLVQLDARLRRLEHGTVTAARRRR